MARTASRPPVSSAERVNLYQQITDRIIAQLEAGCVPWVQPWSAGSGTAAIAMPRNAATGRPYSGINVMLLWDAAVVQGYTNQRWLTFNQARALGGSVRRGERSTMAVYADRFTPKNERQRADRDGDAARSIPFLKRFNLFNVEQCDGLPAEIGTPLAPPCEDLIVPRFRELMEASGVSIRIGGDKAFYSPSPDVVVLPPPEAFPEPINFHRTAAHELSHATGHASRLDRLMKTRHGSPCYAREELVAEISAAFVCASLGIVPTVRHADYIGNWLEVLRDDNHAIVRAASQASKAADWLLNRLPGSVATTAADEDDGDRIASEGRQEAA